MEKKFDYQVIFLGSKLKNYYHYFNDKGLKSNYFDKIDNFVEFVVRNNLCLEEIVVFIHAGSNDECYRINSELENFFQYFFLVTPTICVVDNFEDVFKNHQNFVEITRKYDYLINVGDLKDVGITISRFVFHRKREELERKKYELINQAIAYDLYEEYVKNGRVDIPAFYYGVDYNGIIKTIDDRILNILGFSKNEIVGKHFSEIIADEELDKVSKAYMERRTGERSSRGIVIKFKRKDGGVSEFIVDAQGVHLPTVKENPRKEPARLYVGTYGKLKSKATNTRDVINIDLFNITNEPVFIYMIKKGKLYINKSFEKFLGYSQNEVLNKDPSFFEKKEHSFFNRALIDLKTKNRISYSTVVVKKSGEPVNCDVKVDKVDVNGKQYLIGMYQDISDLIGLLDKADGLIQLSSFMISSKSRDELIRMATKEIIKILDVIYLGIALWCDEKNRIKNIYVTNRNEVELYDSSKLKKLNRYLKIIQESYKENVIRYVELDKEIMDPFANEKNKKIKVGDFISIPLVVNEKKLGCMFVFTDLYKTYTLKDIRMLELSSHILSSGIYRYELENKLRMNLDTLERMVKERTRELEEFVYTVSHDLKSPLYAAKSFADIIKEELAGKFDSEENNYILKRIGVNIETAVRMINDLLKLSRVGTTELKKEKINIKDIVDRYLLQFKAVNKDNVNLTVNINKNPYPIYGDKERIEELFTNLFDNAVKYRKSDRVVISLESKRINGKVRITVEDNGIGIPNEEKDNIFKVFYRGKAALDKKIEGSGCGLSIVKKIVEMHNGTIKVGSKPGEGTKFIIELPAD